MNKNIDYYRSIQNATGCKTRKDMEMNAIHKRLERNFQNTLDIETYVNFLTGENIDLEISSQSKSDISGFQKSFTSLISSPIQYGDTLYNEEENIYWICTEVMRKSGLYYVGKLTRCNNILRWQDDNGSIFEYPVFDINSTQYNSGIQENKVAALGSTQHMLKIVADENTIALRHDKRFFWDRNTKSPTVYKLTQNDTTALNYDRGLLHLTITEDQYNPDTDSIEDWLCDMKPLPVNKDINIIYTGEAVIRIGGAAKTFTADTDNMVSWNLDMTQEQENSITYTESGNKIKIKCANNAALIGSSIKLSCASDMGDTGEVLIKIIGGV